VPNLSAPGFLLPTATFNPAVVHQQPAINNTGYPNNPDEQATTTNRTRNLMSTKIRVIERTKKNNGQQ
jgi:hypothetical protein